MYANFNNLRNKNPNLTMMIGIGGWNDGSTKYSLMANNSVSRREFINSVVEFLETYNFDGLDLDWYVIDLIIENKYLLSNREYPGFQDYGQKIGNPNDKENFAVLIKELHDAFQQKGYVLSAAVAAEKYKIDIAYDVPSLSKYLNFINLMTYDFHGSWVNETGANAPLHPKANDAKINQELTVEFAVNYWLMKGADPKKIVSLF